MPNRFQTRLQGLRAMACSVIAAAGLLSLQAMAGATADAGLADASEQPAPASAQPRGREVAAFIADVPDEQVLIDGLRLGVAHYVLDENDGLAEIGSALKREQEPALRS